METAPPAARDPSYERSRALADRAARAIPAGCHTYSKGADQFPELAPGFIVEGQGAWVLDVDENRFLDWGMGLRSVILGHAYPRVSEAVIGEVRRGSNFTRPSPIETEVAERLIDMIPSAEMVKFAKNGSDVTSAAIRLARAYTGRPLIAFPQEHPFFSFDDWFIGSTVMDAGVPEETKALSLRFGYGDLESLERLFAQHPGRIACVISEMATTEEPPPGFLQGLRDLTRREGAVLVFDEMITGLRWHPGGAQSYYGVTPDLSTFGKALANGFSVSALVGRRDIMELGGLEQDAPRVFLLSATHGGETHALAAARETLDMTREGRVTDTVWAVGRALQNGLNHASAAAGLGDVVACGGYPCSPILTFAAERSDGLRTLFMQEMARRGVLIPYIAPSVSHGEEELAFTIGAAEESLKVVRRVLDGEPLERLLVGPPVQRVFRRFNRPTA